MNETETMPQTAPETFEAKTDTLKLISETELPQELKQHFLDIIQIMGHETNVNDGSRARQVMNIADELNMAKRLYLDKHEITDDPKINELIYEIVQAYTRIN